MQPCEVNYYHLLFADEDPGVQRGQRIFSHHTTRNQSHQGSQLVPVRCKGVHPVAPAPSQPCLSGHSLWMQLVQGTVHTHSDPQVLKPLVFSPLLHNGSQTSATELGCPPGHGSAHLLHHDAVLTCAVQAELLQDPPDLEKGQPIAAGRKNRMSGPASWGPGTCST